MNEVDEATAAALVRCLLRGDVQGADAIAGTCDQAELLSAVGGFTVGLGIAFLGSRQEFDSWLGDFLTRGGRSDGPPPESG